MHASGGFDGVNRSPGKLVVIDDLPHVQYQDGRSRLVNALKQLAGFAQHPTICILSDVCPHPDDARQDAANKEHLVQDEIRQVLQESGSEHIALPAVNKTNILKALRRACQLEGLDAHTDCIEKVSTASNGNLKSSLHMLQMAMVGSCQEHSRRATPVKVRKSLWFLYIVHCECSCLFFLCYSPRRAMQTLEFTRTGKVDQQCILQICIDHGLRGYMVYVCQGRGKRKRQSVSTKHPMVAEQLIQDHHLSSFHALGKILYNKREKACGKGKTHVGSQRLLPFTGIDGLVGFIGDNQYGSMKDK